MRATGRSWGEPSSKHGSGENTARVRVPGIEAYGTCGFGGNTQL